MEIAEMTQPTSNPRVRHANINCPILSFSVNYVTEK